MVEEKAIACSFVQGTRSCSNVKVYFSRPVLELSSLSALRSLKNTKSQIILNQIQCSLINADFELSLSSLKNLQDLIVKFQTQWIF
ncbi:unnamed protein product [Nesidiocoris tenuis]|uniref:Uncharacterized protein n=1 Tax=Nesidiocoris tenuis TaxID=355587 RepID=A0A6H5HTW9_9HEMI|nr:unnamed protein product [Nesidiocoris tenuis]